MKNKVSSSALSERTLRYWKASSSWHGHGKPMTQSAQNEALQSALDHGNSGSRIYDRANEQINRLIKYGFKPKKGLKRFKKNEVVQLKRSV